MSNLSGAAAFRKRLSAIAATKVFTPLGKAWADEAVNLGRNRVGSYSMPYSGRDPQYRLVPSIRRKTANQRRAVVIASYHAYFVDAGTQGAGPSSRLNRAKARGLGSFARQTIFAPKAVRAHRGYRARPFRAYMAAEALRRHPMADELVKAWNAAG